MKQLDPLFTLFVSTAMNSCDGKHCRHNVNDIIKTARIASKFYSAFAYSSA